MTPITAPEWSVGVLLLCSVLYSVAPRKAPRRKPVSGAQNWLPETTTAPVQLAAPAEPIAQPPPLPPYVPIEASLAESLPLPITGVELADELAQENVETQPVEPTEETPIGAGPEAPSAEEAEWLASVELSRAEETTEVATSAPAPSEEREARPAEAPAPVEVPPTPAIEVAPVPAPVPPPVEAVAPPPPPIETISEEPVSVASESAEVSPAAAVQEPSLETAPELPRTPRGGKRKARRSVVEEPPVSEEPVEATPVPRAEVAPPVEPEPITVEAKEAAVPTEPLPEVPVGGPQLSVRALIARMNAQAKQPRPPLSEPTPDESERLEELPAGSKNRPRSSAEKPGEKS